MENHSSDSGMLDLKKRLYNSISKRDMEAMTGLFDEVCRSLGDRVASKEEIEGLVNERKPDLVITNEEQLTTLNPFEHSHLVRFIKIIILLFFVFHHFNFHYF